MFNIRTPGKSIANLLMSAFGMFRQDPNAFSPERFKALMEAGHTVEVPATTRNTPQARQRRAEGIPHGVPGAKLTRKALNGRIGLKG